MAVDVVTDPAVLDEAELARARDGRAEPATEAAAPLIEQDSLVEDVSIDGMCGVY
jgi:mycofactocin precursor